MIRTVKRGATREELEADLARVEALEQEDESWRGITDVAKSSLRTRIELLDRRGADKEIRLDALPLDPRIAR